MNEKYIQILGIVVACTYGLFVAFLYAAEPRSVEEITIKAKQTVENAVTKGTVVIGTYEVDQVKFNEGLQAFRQDNFAAARDLFQRADPESRDAKVQFYISYSYYRQGWGRVSSDDALFTSSLESLARVSQLDPDFKSDDANLQLKTTAELRAELEEGLKVTADDFNPFRVFRERK
jgi:hypothetical protein